MIIMTNMMIMIMMSIITRISARPSSSSSLFDHVCDHHYHHHHHHIYCCETVIIILILMMKIIINDHNDHIDDEDYDQSSSWQPHWPLGRLGACGLTRCTDQSSHFNAILKCTTMHCQMHQYWNAVHCILIKVNILMQY